MKDDSIYLKHVRDAIAKIESYTEGGRGIFFENSMVQDAVIRNLKIIGEAVRSLSPELKERRPDIPWRSITALRNLLIHEYFGVDLKIVWGIVRRRLPPLRRHVETLLAKSRR